ncbi:hypothetical protein EDC94DRAFT_594605 [Helicostylum pulchrum]|uniref:NodB homology domain-containing protein n=1 Tax=Helicostylum pulchrum TaxID=562976 RepID=A0ABP9XQC9_9FUNG|nr:hypothetical protein EDC94DRAFT_594605 [Helicostylum pulchrum]
MTFSLFLSRISILALALSLVQAQDSFDEIKTPQNAKWLESVDLSSVPKMPVRKVGSGICPDAACDGADNDRCFESCGNNPSPEDIYGCPQDHQWALTFDDGPSKYTGELLDILDKEDIKATFCVMGSHVDQYADVLKRAYDSGHQIASHTFSHPHLMSLTNEEIIYEVKATEDAIEKVIGVKPRYIRPPFGEADDRVKGLLKSMGYKVLLWNVDPTDYDVYMLQDVSSLIQGTFKMAISGNDTGLNLNEDPGFISLQHDLYKQSVDQVPKIISFLKKKGFSFLTAAACNNDMSPHSGSEDAINSSSETSKDTTIAPPKVLVEEAPEDASISDASVADNKSTVSGSSMAIASNASYVMSLAILVLSVTILF